MDKLVYIRWDSKAHMADSRQQVLLRQVSRDLLAAGAEKLTMYIADRDAKRVHIRRSFTGAEVVRSQSGPQTCPAPVPVTSRLTGQPCTAIVST